jgi:hypothetical protein
MTASGPGIPPRSYARTDLTRDLIWSEISTANRRRAARDPKSTRELVHMVGERARELTSASRALTRELEGIAGGRVRYGTEQLRDRVEDAVADLVLTADLLAERWSMDVPHALAQLFNERGIRDGDRERINPKKSKDKSEGRGTPSEDR